jgi:hypothetical protein
MCNYTYNYTFIFFPHIMLNKKYIDQAYTIYKRCDSQPCLGCSPFSTLLQNELVI